MIPQSDLRRLLYNTILNFEFIFTYLLYTFGGKFTIHYSILPHRNKVIKSSPVSVYMKAFIITATNTSWPYFYLVESVNNTDSNVSAWYILSCFLVLYNCLFLPYTMLTLIMMSQLYLRKICDSSTSSYCIFVRLLWWLILKSFLDCSCRSK